MPTVSGSLEGPPVPHVPCGRQASVAGLSTTIAGSPTAHEVRKNSSYLHSAQLAVGPTRKRLARTSEPMPPLP